MDEFKTEFKTEAMDVMELELEPESFESSSPAWQTVPYKAEPGQGKGDRIKSETTDLHAQTTYMESSKRTADIKVEMEHESELDPGTFESSSLTRQPASYDCSIQG